MAINCEFGDVDAHGAGGARDRRAANPPNIERQVHKACGDINAAVTEALETLAGLTLTQADAFGVARVQTALYRARQANHLLGQMVGTPIERRQPWAHYRSRLGDKVLQHLSVRADKHSAGAAAEGRHKRQIA
ncbi:hypothetical protein [uncultured Mycobacterium sp.]|uniref:hypothetical protein n=1 Tax=uncultured Mycobacterium sp. TaxID=171292 RepID=UPI0035CB30A2